MSNSMMNDTWVEVIAAWGDHVLSVHHAPLESVGQDGWFVLGDGEEEGGQRRGDSKSRTCDFYLPRGAMTVARLALISFDGAKAQVNVPHGAEGSLERESQELTSFESLRGDPSVLGTSMLGVTLESGAIVHVDLGSISFHVSLCPAEEVPNATRAAFDKAAAGWFAATFATAAAFFGTLIYSMPDMGLLADEELNPKRLLAIQQYLDASAERERQREEPRVDGERESAAQGEADKPAEINAASGPKTDNPRPAKSGKAGGGPSREEILNEARQGLMVAVLLEDAATFTEFVRAGSLADLSPDHATELFIDGIGEGSGMGMLSGRGAGAGGLGAGVGIDDIGGGLTGGGGTMKHGWGRDGIGMGCCGRDGGGGHRAKAPIIRIPPPTTSGRLPPSAIQRVVRQNFGRFRMCYEEGLRKNPSLEGRVAVRFLIGSDGRVTTASPAAALPDPSVTSCVVSAFRGLSFPKPENGTVSVTYPIAFTPG